MNQFQISILTPEGQIFQDTVEAVAAPGALGSFGVLANHAPMIVSLAPGVLTVDCSGKRHFFTVDAGVLEVDAQGNVLVLVDHSQPCGSVEEAKSKIEELKAAQHE